MKKIVILGCENSHANTFLDFIFDTNKFPGVEVVGIYSDESAAAISLQEKYGVPIMKSYEEAVNNVDGVIITARDGGKHYKYAKPYINSGIPMFIDKPIAISENEAIKFMEELKNANVKISGGSCCKYDPFVQELKQDVLSGIKTVGGFVRAPIQRKSVYGGFYFYAQHLVDIVLEIFGRNIKSVQAVEAGQNISVLFRYADFDVNGLYVENNYLYYASRQGEKEAKRERRR